MTRLQDRDYPILVELYLNCLLSQAKNKKTKGWGELRQSKDQGQGGGVTRSLNQRDRRPVVNTSSLHSAKTRAKTKQEKHHKNKTQKHRVTTDMCGITNSSTCFFSRSTTMGCATVQPYIRPPFIGPSGKISQLKNVSPLPPIVGAPSFKTNHLWAEVPFPERYVWPRAVTSHHPGHQYQERTSPAALVMVISVSPVAGAAGEAADAAVAGVSAGGAAAVSAGGGKRVCNRLFILNMVSTVRNSKSESINISLNSACKTMSYSEINHWWNCSSGAIAWRTNVACWSKLFKRTSDRGLECCGSVMFKGVSGGWFGHSVRSNVNMAWESCDHNCHTLVMNFGRPICSISSLQAETILSNASKRSSWRFCAICIFGWTGSRKWNAMLMAAVSPMIASGDISSYRGCVQRFGSELGNAADTYGMSQNCGCSRTIWKEKWTFGGGSENGWELQIFLRPKMHLRSKWTCCTNVKTQNQYESNHCTFAQQVEASDSNEYTHKPELTRRKGTIKTES